MSSKQRNQSQQTQPPRAGDGGDLAKQHADALGDVSASLTPEAMAAQMAQLAEQRKVTMAQAIALALLRNPGVHTYLGGSPLEPLRRGDLGDHDTVGAYLAHESLRLADDYCDALDALVKARRPDVRAADVPSATPTT
jgi:hypothetical protein